MERIAVTMDNEGGLMKTLTTILLSLTLIGCYGAPLSERDFIIAKDHGGLSTVASYSAYGLIIRCKNGMKFNLSDKNKYGQQAEKPINPEGQ